MENKISSMDQFTCLIPARKGSKRIKNKNLQKLGGLTLVDHAIGLAKSGGLRCVLSTDIEDFFDAELYSSVEVRKRPKHLCSDVATMESVISDAIVNCALAGRNIILLQPTSPFRTLEQMLKCAELFLETQCSLLLSALEADPSVLKYYVEKDELVCINDDKYLFTNSQALPKVYKPNGAFYIFNASNFLRNGFDVTNVRVFKMDTSSSLDIDTAEDLERARHQAGRIAEIAGNSYDRLDLRKK